MSKANPTEAMKQINHWIVVSRSGFEPLDVIEPSVGRSGPLWRRAASRARRAISVRRWAPVPAGGGKKAEGYTMPHRRVARPVVESFQQVRDEPGTDPRFSARLRGVPRPGGGLRAAPAGPR